MNNNSKKLLFIFRYTLMIIISLVLFCAPKSAVNAAVKVGDVTNFSYTGGIQRFTAPATGYYLLEVWGGQGGSTNGYRGGYGGYSVGTTFLKKGETIYVVVGGAGSYSYASTYSGAYNGGGSCRAYVLGSARGYCGAGGGATHIAKVSGILPSLSGYKGSLNSTGAYYVSEKILIVAGGGGGAAYTNNVNYGYGGNGGGYVAGSATTSGAAHFTTNGYGTGGSQTKGGCLRSTGGVTSTKCGSFGQGYSDTSEIQGAANTAGGGGGFFGGGGTRVNSSGGGSGYIASSNLITYGSYTKAMYCYSCSTSSNKETYTVSTTSVSSTATSKYAKSGSGYARITIVGLSYTDARLSSLDVSGGSFNQTFDPDIYEYDVVVDSENSTVSITGEPIQTETVVNGLGDYDLIAGTTDVLITSTAENGNIALYTLHITRPASPYPYLKDIKVDGQTISGFTPETLEYDVTVDANTMELSLDYVKGRPSQEVYATSDLTLKSGNNQKEIVVVSEDGTNIVTYVLNIYKPHTSKLKSIVIDGYELTPEFDPDTLEYSINLMASTLSLKVTTVPYDEEAKVTLKGFGYIKSSTTATITVTEPNSEPTVYKVKITKEGSVEESSYDFPYTGKIQTFVAPATGYYQLETWGAQGGTVSSYRGGYGGYSTGAVFLNKDDVLYVVVGGAGSYSYAGVVGESYNGGGACRAYTLNSYRGYCASGGGATHIAKVSGVLSSLSSYKGSLNSSRSYYVSEDILIVAGGGGGGSYTNNWNYGYGGHGGGYIAGSAQHVGAPHFYANGYGTGGTQVSGGYRQTSSGADLSRSGTFGKGYSDYTSTVGASNTAGGGGGFFGGGGTYVNSSGGGSGYIASSKLISYKDVTKSMYCYGCSTSTNENTYTVSTTRVSSTPTSYYAKTGSGYARITLLPQPSENNFLTSITVKTTDYETGVTTTKEYTPEYDMETEDYYLEVGATETTAILSARPEDSLATIEGLGTFEVLAGENIYEIVVTAESGHTKTYRVHITREASSNSLPIDITISGLVPSLCAVNDAFCALNPEKFDPNTNSYYLTVPSRIKQLWFDVEKGHPYQTVYGEGKVSLEGGENVITIAVESEDKSGTTVYKYYVTRDMTGNTDLSVLEIIDPERDINYEPDVTEYYLSVPNEYTEIKEMLVETDDPNASYIITGNENFKTGMNQVYILVTAANGETKTYILNVYREKSGNTYISNLEVKTSETRYDLVPEFNKVNLGTYNVTVPNDIDKVEIVATPEVDTTKITGTGEVSLKTGANNYAITATAEDGSIEVYNLTITREKNSNANLSAIEVKSTNGSYDLSPDFNKDTLEYTVTVEEGVAEVNITATPEVSTTTYKLLDNNTIRVGENIKRIMAIAEDGTTKTYTVTIIRPANNNNYLESLTVIANDTELELTPSFDKEKIDYTLEVENEITSVKVVGVAENALSSVNGNGTYYLSVSENEISISVTAEDGGSRKYTIMITRKANSNAYLSSITTSEGILAPTFDKEKKEYVINVENYVDRLTINATPEVATTTISGTGELTNLESGTTEVKIITTAEDGTSLTYVVKIVKDTSDNDNLSYLLMEEGDLSPKFNPNVILYNVTVPYEVEKGTFHVELEDEKASYEIIGNENFVVGENTVIVRVTSESGSTKDYTVIVTRQEEKTSSNYLTSLKVNKGTLTPEFDKENQYYEVEVPYEESNITVTATKEDSDAYVTGLGTYTLEVGKNLIVVTVEGTDGKIREYQIVVTRGESSEARLSNLVIAGTTLSPKFDKDTYEYYLTTDSTYLDFITVTTVDINASYEVVGNYFPENGEYVVKIIVIAPDGKTTKEYVLNVTKEPSNNNNLSHLEVVGYEISPSFSKTTTLYTLTVGNDVNSILIEATSEEPNATVSGDGVQYLLVGTNYFVVEVTSESGNVKAYTIIVTKEGSSNNNIMDLIVNNGTMSPDFVSTTTSYDVVVPYEEESLDLTVILESENASYTVTNNNLSVGLNTVNVVVTAENGDIKIYTLNVTRQEIVSALLEDLKVKNYEITPTFNSNVMKYDVLVDYEVTSLDLTIVPLDKNATYVVEGNSDFVIGDNVVTITVTASDGVTKEIYTLNVKRQAYSNSFLDYLYTSEGDLTPTFDRELMEYTIDVGNEVEKIELIGEAVDKSATVVGLGEHNLNTGANKIAITVTTTSGIKRTYYVTVNRAKDANNYLETLTVKVGTVTYELDPTFDPYTSDYSVSVPVGTQTVNIMGTLGSGSSTVTGLGIQNLNVGENIFKIVVTSENGENRIYTITVTRPASSNNYLTELIPSVGTLEPEFSYEETKYTINLDSSASLLSFKYATEYAFATVSGTEPQVVPDGTSTRQIIVTAEDGSTRVYTITINKERTDNANLANLYVNGYSFEETFDPDVYEYHITVPNSKQVLLASEVVATAEDKNATITKSGNINLVTGDGNVYVVKVTAPDGFTTKEYRIIITRETSSEAILNSLIVNTGYLTTTFNPNVYEYTWKVGKGITLTTDSVTATASNNATILKTEVLEVTSGGEVYEVKVISEDGSQFVTYTLTIELDLSSDATLGSLEVDKGYYEPTFDSNTFVYNVYEYVDTESIEVTAIPNNEKATVISGNGTVILEDELTIHTIVVESENGTTETYTLNIYKTILRDEGLKNLGLNGLDSLECIKEQCVISPTFDTDIIAYSIKVPYEYTNLDILAEVMNEQQTVKYKINDEYITSYQLPLGKTEVVVEVYDGMVVKTKEYTLTIERCKSNNTNLASLKVSYGTDDLTVVSLSPEFDKHVLEYSGTIPTEIEEVIVEAKPEDENAKVVINGYTYLQEGSNIVTVQVIAADGTTKEYLIDIIREPLYNSYLKNITVSTGVFWELSPNFKPTVYDYTTTITTSDSRITLEAVPAVSTTTVSGTGEYDIVVGSNIFKLTATAEDGSISVYTVNVIKENSRNVNLTNLIVEEGNLSPSFDSGITKYEVNVDSDVDKLTIHVILADKTSSYIITGNEQLVTGANTVNVIVLSADGSASKTYQLTVNKAASSNDYLSDLSVSDDNEEYSLVPTYNKDILEYKVDVDASVEKVTVSATAEDETAIITGTGEEYLAYGNNEVLVSVTSENGSVRVYTVNIYRNYNLDLKLIVSDIGELDPKFSKDITNYHIKLGTDDDEITFVAQKESNQVTVTGNGTYELSYGENTIEFVVTAPDGKTKTYTVVVERPYSDNNYIESLVVHEGAINPEFDRATQSYEVSVRNTVTSIGMDIVLEAENATYEVIGNENLQLGNNEVIIRVKAANGATRDYVINVILQDDSAFSNLLTDLYITDGEINPDFDPNINYYAATVANSVSSTEIVVVKESVDATVEGAGVVQLELGRNVFQISITSKDGIVNTYTLVINREENSDATLSSLIVKNYNYLPIFNKQIENYALEVESDVTKLEIEAIPTDPNSTVEITGHKNLVTGTNTVSILVTAPDGVTTKTYTITVTKTISTNNYLSSLSVVGYSFSPEYVKTNQGPYVVNVENDVNSIVVEGTPEVETTTVTGLGKYELTTGQNVITVQATSESGEVRVYTIIVNKSKNSDSSLRNIITSDGSLNPTFNSEVLEYEIEVDSSLENITITGVANSPTSTVTGNGTYTLEEAETEVKLVVTAEDGSKTTYTVKVVKNTESSSKIIKLVIKEGVLYPSFHKNTTNYTILVPNEITELKDMEITLEDENATYEVIGNSDFVVGNNTVIIRVTSADGTTTTDYNINVVRQIVGSNYLKSLEVVGYNLTPVFDKYTLYYVVNVPSDTEEVQIVATKEDVNATLSGTGYKTLTEKENRYYIKVTSASGAVRTYSVVINKTLEEENLLLTLETSVGTISPTFDPYTNEYTIEVPEKTETITLTGTASPNTTVVGLGTSNVELGEQTRSITVTSESGEVNVYNIKVVRPGSSNTELESLTPSAGSLEYSNEILEYEMTVEENVSVISFEAIPVDEDATVTGTDLTTLEYGKNEIIITVTAEDGVTTREIKITVIREKALTAIIPDETELILSIDEIYQVGYTLEPIDTSYPEVEWISNDENIVTVDQDGNITAVGLGSTTVQIRSTYNPNIMATINVNVINKLITSSVYEVNREGEVAYVIGNDPKTMISEYIENFDNNPSTLYIYDSDGNEIIDSSTYVGSRMTIKLIINEVEYDSLTIVVRGDYTGDGLVTAPDTVNVKNMILGKVETTYIDRKIADITKDDLVTAPDTVRIKNYILGKDVLN